MKNVGMSKDISAVTLIHSRIDHFPTHSTILDLVIGGLSGKAVSPNCRENRRGKSESESHSYTALVSCIGEAGTAEA